MTGRILVPLLCALASAAPAAAQSEPATVLPRYAQAPFHTFDQRRTYNGPPLTLQHALDEALARNPTLLALRRQFEVARTRPAQERFLMPPTFEAQIWQWPINTLNPANTTP